MARENALSKVEEKLLSAIDAAKAGGITKDEIIQTLTLLCNEEGL
jgi:alkylhydroperoxidase/carboxymuconolactone decarboxylase family protein YurZ